MYCRAGPGAYTINWKSLNWTDITVDEVGLYLHCGWSSQVDVPLHIAALWYKEVSTSDNIVYEVGLPLVYLW